MAELIRCAYLEEEALPVHLLKDLLALPPEEIKRYICYSGHFGTALLPLLDKKVACVTMLRDPFERTVSHLRYWRRNARFENLIRFADGDVRRAERMRDGEIEEVLADPAVATSLQDFQTRVLGVDLDIEGLRASAGVLHDAVMTVFRTTRPMEEIAAAARQRLASMDVVGITERFEDSARLVCDLLRIPEPQTWPVRRVSPEKLALSGRSYRETFSREVVERVDALTVWDRLLYDHGQSLLARKLSERPAMPRPTRGEQTSASDPRPEPRGDGWLGRLFRRNGA